MSVIYVVEEASASTGPWTAVSGSPFSTTTDTVAGLAASTAYYFRITAKDTLLGISAAPTVVGPIVTSASAIVESQQNTRISSAAATTVPPVGPITALNLSQGGSPTIAGISLSNSTLATELSAGAIVGTVTTIMGSGSFTGSLSLGGPDAASFRISGQNLVTATALTARTYQITITATQSGISNSPFTQSFTIQGIASGLWMNHFAFGGNEFYLSFVGEIEYMCDNGTGHVSSTGYNPFSLSNSVLSITAQTVAKSGISNPAGQLWNSGCITSCTETNSEPTAGLFARQTGYFEIRCQVPSGGPANGGPGFWPAFVLYPLAPTSNGVVTGNAPPGEIDIFEILGGSTGTVRQSIHTSVAGASHEYDYTGAGDMSVGFHTIGCDVQSNFLTFYVDGVQTAQQATPSDFITNGNIWYINVPFSVGGPGSWVGAPSVSVASDTGAFQIDYIGVWTNRAAAYPGGALSKSAALFLDDFNFIDVSFSGAAPG